MKLLYTTLLSLSVVDIHDTTATPTLPDRDNTLQSNTSVDALFYNLLDTHTTDWHYQQYRISDEYSWPI